MKSFKNFTYQIIFGAIFLLLIQFSGVEVVNTVLGYVLVFTVIMIILRILFSIFKFLKYNKDSRNRRECRDARKNNKFYKNIFGFIVGYFMWLFLKSK